MANNLKLSDAVKLVLDGADSDETYDKLCPVSPGSYQFNRPKKDKDGKDIPLKPFADAYPEYLTRGKFRDKVEAAQAKKKAAPTPAPRAEET